MNELEQQLLEMVRKDYSITEIKEKTTIKLQDLFLSFITLLKTQVFYNIDNNLNENDLIIRTMLRMDQLVDNKEVPKSTGLKKIRAFKAEIRQLETTNTTSQNFINLVHASLRAFEAKIKEEKRRRFYENEYENIDAIIFDDKDINQVKLMLKEKNFNIRYANNMHLTYFLVEEYIEALKEESEDTLYYRELIDYVLINSKFKLKHPEKVGLNYEITKAIEKIKRNKKLKNRKTVLNHLNTLNNKLKNKDLILFNTKTKKSFTNNRKNLTNDYTITIDTHGTRIFDDAISLKPLKNGNYLLGVHIVDTNSLLSHKLSVNEHLLELIRDKCNPMPTNISMFENCPVIKDLTLKRNEARPTNSLLVELNKKGEIIDYDFVKAIIKVNDNLNLNEIEKKLRDKNENEPLYNMLSDLVEVAAALRSKNEAKEIYTGLKILTRDSRNLSDPYFDITKTQFEKGRMIVQESMILYNYLLSSYFADMQYPFIYKNRESKEEIFQNPDEINKVIEKLKAKNHSNQKIIQALVSLYPETEYSIENKGNSALQLPNYCSSTSPLRYGVDKLSGLALDKCYFKDPKDKELYMMQDVYGLLAHYINKPCKQVEAEPEITEIQTYTKKCLTKIRNN